MNELITPGSGAPPGGPRIDAETMAGASIYLADDEPANRLLLEQILARGGFSRVRSFADGRALLEACARDEPDLILLDLRMPKLDGFAVLEELRGRSHPERYLPIIVLTADATGEARKQALSAGATDFLTKPFDRDEVLLRSRNLLETRFLYRALAGRVVTLGDEVAAGRQTIREVATARAAVAASLDRVSGFDEPDAIAANLCADLASAIDAQHVTLLLFESPDRLVSFVAHNPRSSADVGYALPRARSQELWQGASIGPWVEERVARADRGADGERLAAAGWRSAINAPVRSGDDLVGVLSAGSATERSAAELARNLPSVIEYAALMGALLGRRLAHRRQAADVRHSLETIIAERAFSPVFQPIVELVGSRIVGHEALTRFADGVRPDERFANALTVGLGLELELATIEAAVEASRVLPTGTWLSLNVSPTAVLAGAPLAPLLRAARHPLVIELTEHVPVNDYPELRRAIAGLGQGIRVAVDDAGAGYASMQHVVELRPDLIKLDISLVRGIDMDTARQALVAGMRYFAEQTTCLLLGEGIETAAERETLGRLGVSLGQGYLLGRPAPAATDAQASRLRNVEAASPR
jgi:EAL domain-containing protein (putative c-di-GMP-specific phosphodiesterase class I)/CheY-like chemotaxis protein